MVAFFVSAVLATGRAVDSSTVEMAFPIFIHEKALDIRELSYLSLVRGLSWWSDWPR
jgi:hypothetical protein